MTMRPLYSKHLRGVTFSSTEHSSVPTLFEATQWYVPEYSLEAFFKRSSPVFLSAKQKTEVYHFPTFDSIFNTTELLIQHTDEILTQKCPPERIKNLPKPVML